MPRKIACTADMRRGRMRKATGFLEAANLLADQPPAEAGRADALITLCIHAGAAASDVICCARLGEHAQGDNHAEAVALLRQRRPRPSELSEQPKHS